MTPTPAASLAAAFAAFAAAVGTACHVTTSDQPLWFFAMWLVPLAAVCADRWIMGKGTP